MGRSPGDAIAAAPIGAAPVLPKRLDRYELLVPIGRGGMATVYLARMRGLRGFEREVAIKRMHAHLSGALESMAAGAADLLEEAKLAALIRHPTVVSVFDVGEDEEGVHLVMPYIEGESLAGILRRMRAQGESMGVPVVLRILMDALSGLHAAHQLCDAKGASLGLVHRDFSPQNILVGIDGVTLLTDFGIAKVANRDGLTQEGLVKGKTGYMSPEQVRGQPLDRRSDVWAAGVVAWEAFAHRRLYPPSNDAVATALSICTERPRRLRSVCPDVPEAVDEAIASALVLEQAQRCPTVEEFRRRLAEAWEVAPADATEVAGVVARVAGAELAERRRRAEEASRAGEATTAGTGVAVSTMRTASPASGWKRVTVAGLGLAVVIAAASTITRTARPPPIADSPLSPVPLPSTRVAVIPTDSVAVAPTEPAVTIPKAPSSKPRSRSAPLAPSTRASAGPKRAPVSPPSASATPTVNTSLLGENPYEAPR